MIKGFHHVAIYTENFEKSCAFYTALGGKKVHSFNSLGTGKEIALFELAKGAVVEIIQHEAPKCEGSFPHIAIETDDADGLYELMLSAGAEIKMPLQSVNLGTMPVKNAFLLGPDKEVIEVFEVR